jgi:hypothetical protein
MDRDGAEALRAEALRADALRAKALRAEALHRQSCEKLRSIKAAARLPKSLNMQEVY